jgi:2'-5' RNA ligase
MNNAADSIFIQTALKVAEADVSNGAMVALMPASEFIDELAIGGYEPPDQLHVTLLYLGKQADWSEQDRQQLRQFIGYYFINCVQVHAEIRAHAVFNPGSDEPASVYLIGGQGALVCEDFAKLLRSEVDSGKYAVEVPNDYPFYLPHLTIGYDLNVDKLTYTGPIVFDTVRIVFGGDSTDIPLRPLEEENDEGN